jgi:hypothetical protein
MLRRILTILAILASVGVVVVSQTKLKDHINGIRETRDTYEKQRNNETSRANKAETNLKTTSNTLVRTAEDLKARTKELATTKDSLDNVTASRDKTMQDLEKSKEAERTARQSLAMWDALGVKPDQVKAMQVDLSKNKEAVLALEEETKVLGREIAKLTNELNRYRDPDNYVVQLPAGLKGNIVVVDPKWEFVVLDIGQKQGVLKDGVMMVHRDSKLIGKVRITTVMPDRSIANLVHGWRLDDIREGDKVLF